ncbi:MAG: hypothetical protein HYV42_00380 [Candidatus Magasanikbacteria bacterium]|nr:hypothetical protein [Candidatus Magasanikbacteria bacterium]
MPKPVTKNSIVATLAKLGLGENEAQLYAAMLRSPKSTVQELQVRSPLPRTMLYYVLNHLIRRGLVAAVKEQWRTVYVAESPERLYDLLAAKEQEFSKDTQAVRQLIPELKEKYRLAAERPDVRILEGMGGYQKALEDILITQPDTIYAYVDLITKKSGVEIRETHENRRIAKKIPKRILLTENAPGSEQIKKLSDNDFTQFRFATTPLAGQIVDLQLYNGKILYTTYAGREPIVMLIEDQKLFAMQKNIFDVFWSQAKDATGLFSNKRI